jgi:hypothetical protein
VNESSFDGLTRQLGRRRALQALGAAVMATAGGGSLAGAKKGKNTQQKNRKKKQQQRIDEQALGLCAGQVAACDAFIAEDCDGDAGCLAQGQLCCDLLATCAFTEFIACINAPVNNPDL